MTKSVGLRALGVWVALVALMALSSCKVSGKGLPVVEPGDGLGGNGAGGQTQDAGPIVKCEPTDQPKELGVACGCNEECGSGSCVHGVCCTGSCDGVCQACNVPGKLGTCSPVPQGSPPATSTQCKQEDPSTCGLDGTCDGAGACQKYEDGTTCTKGRCDGASVVDAKACRAGKCEAGPKTICAPFACKADTASCVEKCASNDDCAPGKQCKDGSCGKKILGAKCQAATDCESGNCADGVCCNTSCDSGCVSCNQVDKMGECAPVAKDQKDPHGVCKDQGPENCKTTGTCDGNGGCSVYSSSTICRAAKCEGANLIPMGTCDGKGSCQSANQVPCRPNMCVGNACSQVCTSNSQCSDGNVCRNGSCGPRGKGQSCTLNSQCGSGFCVDGVCCESECKGQCRFCASPQALGSCINVPANTMDPRLAAGITDPTKVCIAQSKETCGRSGMCNGNGACQLWDNKTKCSEQTCSSSSNIFTEAKMCDGFGVCKAQGSRSCSPNLCNGSSCSTVCTEDKDCAAPNTCVNNRCGPKPSGSICSNDNECSSNFCRQGVCCQTDCKGSCFSCGLERSRGICTAVPAGGQDPARVCRDDGVASCDRDGTCDGSGKCRLYASGQICAGSTCSAGTSIATSTCNGRGDCVPGATRLCDAFKCNPEGTACYESCIDNNQCVVGRACVNGSCGKKPVGGSCEKSDECLMGNCFQGFCCNAVCDSPCKSCGLQGRQGTCSNIGPGDPPRSGTTCNAGLPKDCGNSGFCDGNGACAKYANTVVCRDQSCPANANTQVLEAKCDGNGSCPALTSRSCGNMLCNPQTNQCFPNCTSAAQCVSTSYCDVATMSCGGLKANGVRCEGNNQCQSGKCINSYCCSQTGLAAGGNSCPACQSCGVAGKEGTCQALPAGPEGAGSCPVPSMDTCGQQTCNGQGACTAANPPGTACGNATCVGENQVQARVCSANGSCGAGSTTTCANSFRCVDGACKTSCTVDGDCVTGRVCSNRACVVPKRPQGASCTDGGADVCASGFCADGVCCDKACQGACEACDLSAGGKCESVKGGTEDDACKPGNPGTTNCNTGKCTGNGKCATNTCDSMCSADGASEVGSVCDGKGGCMTSTNMCMGGFKCSGSACLSECSSDANCQAGFYCQLEAMPATTFKKCVEKKPLGSACTGDAQCTGSGKCVQNVCCATACAATAGEPCGNTGYCAADGMSCQKAGSETICGTSCVGNTIVETTCNGAGACSTPGRTVTCATGEVCVSVPTPMCQAAPI